MSKKLFGVIIGLTVIVVSISVVLFLKKNVVSFDDFFVPQNSCTPYNLLLRREMMILV